MILMKRISLSVIAVSALIAGTVFCLSGCTQLERDGFSPIPQNSPAGWELNPYGNLQN